MPRADGLGGSELATALCIGRLEGGAPGSLLIGTTQPAENRTACSTAEPAAGGGPSGQDGVIGADPGVDSGPAPCIGSSKGSEPATASYSAAAVLIEFRRRLASRAEAAACASSWTLRDAALVGIPCSQVFSCFLGRNWTKPANNSVSPANSTVALRYTSLVGRTFWNSFMIARNSLKASTPWRALMLSRKSIASSSLASRKSFKEACAPRIHRPVDAFALPHSNERLSPRVEANCQLNMSDTGSSTGYSRFNLF